MRLITRGGNDWPRCYPWIVEAALMNRIKQFVIAGEGRSERLPRTRQDRRRHRGLPTLGAELAH